MVSIDIDISSIIAQFSLSKSQVSEFTNYAVGKLADKFYESWHDTAAEGLHSTRDIYTEALSTGGSGNVSYVKLDGKLPNMIEDGASGFDMKEGFMNGKNATHKADGGWYNTIAFRHASPTALGENSVFSNVLPTPVYNAVQKVEVLGASDIPKPHDAKGIRKEVVTQSQVFKEYVHKHSKYEGLQKNTGEYVSATQGQYVTFRRVSDKSDANSWIHRGLDARHFMEKSLDNFDIGLELDSITDKFLETI